MRFKPSKNNEECYLCNTSLKLIWYPRQELNLQRHSAPGFESGASSSSATGALIVGTPDRNRTCMLHPTDGFKPLASTVPPQGQGLEP